MKKFYRIFLLVIALIFLSTYTPSGFDLISKKNNTFFKIKKVEVVNNFLVKESEIKNKLKKILEKNIFLIKRKDIEDPLRKIDFLEKIEVKKKYPSTIIVEIFETKPVAVLYENKKKYLIDSSSNLILFKDNMNFNQLPSVFGEGAKDYFIYFFSQLESNNFPLKNVEKFYFFEIGRWDLQLTNTKIIKFPHI